MDAQVGMREGRKREDGMREVGMRRCEAAWQVGVRAGPVPPGRAVLVVLAVLVTAVLIVLLVLVAGTGAASDPAQHAAPGSPAPWSWPTTTRVVLRPWDAPATDYGPGHRGLDVPAPPGTPATAPADGMVAFAGQVGGRTVVTIDHGGGLVSTLDPVEPSVSAGTLVRRGDRVGTVGAGHCPLTTSCLHLGARVDGAYVDPLPLLPSPAWPVLLPDRQARG
ncbi:M23 family peptidase [Curtobacterium sp. MCPF17_011]|nr:M23 family peptidase [Curtobacterium sp. MCPF17_011]